MSRNRQRLLGALFASAAGLFGAGGALAQAATAVAPSTPTEEVAGAKPAVPVNPAFADRAQRMKLIAEARKNRKPKFDRTVGSITAWQAAQARAQTMETRFDEPQGAITHFLSKRVPTGQTTLGPEDYKAALQQAQQMPVHTTSRSGAESLAAPQKAGSRSSRTTGLVSSSASTLGGAWQAMGPGNIGGRTRALLIHPTTPSTMWAAGVAGGIWKSTDSGATWVPKADLLVNIAVNSMILDPRNPNILYAGTGEGFFNADGVRGAGILKSTDGGETWAQLAATANSDFFYVQKIVMSKGSSQRLYAATRTGIFRSTDGGTSWSKMLDGSTVNGCMDLAIQTDRALANVFAACGTFTQSTVYRALDTGSATQTWTAVFSPAGGGRTSLALAPSNQSMIYALVASNVAGNYQDGLLGVYRSTTNGSAGSWVARVTNTSPVKLNTLLLSNPVIANLTECGFGTNQFFNQGWYDNIIAVDPVNPNIVWAGGVDLFRSDDGGANWGQASHWWFTPGVDPEYNHADQHTIVFHPQYNGTTNKIMYTGNDGGVHMTADARAPVSYSPSPVTPTSPVCGNTAPGTVAWQTKNNGYQITQFYHGAVYPDGNTFFGGTQDNGTLRGTVAGGEIWSSIRGGDGGYVAVNPTNTNIVFAENTGLSIQRSANGGTSFSSFTSGITEAGGNFLFITPFAQDPSNPGTMWIGGAIPWRTTQGAAVPTVGSIWTRAGAFFGTRISAWGISPLNSNRVYAGTQTGRVFTSGTALTDTSTSVWASSQPRAGSNYISWVAPDPVSANTVYATVSTFNSGASVGHVFKSVDSGATWVSIDGSGATGIPDVPVHSIVIDPLNTQRMYVGTDIGVFVTTDGGANWARENTGFANVVVESLSISNTSPRYLYAFTHGRSVFRAQLP